MDFDFSFADGSLSFETTGMDMSEVPVPGSLGLFLFGVGGAAPQDARRRAGTGDAASAWQNRLIRTAPPPSTCSSASTGCTACIGRSSRGRGRRSFRRISSRSTRIWPSGVIYATAGYRVVETSKPGDAPQAEALPEA